MNFNPCKSIQERILKNKTFKANKSLFAQKLGMPRESLLNIIKGRTTNPNIQTILQIADYFNLSIDELINRKPPFNNQPPIKNSFSSVHQYNFDLLQKTIHCVDSYIKKHNVTPTYGKVLNAIDSIYDYSIKQNSDAPVKSVADWILEKTFSNSIPLTSS